MAIRLATEQDEDAVVRMCSEFHAASPHSRYPLEETKLRDLVRLYRGVQRAGVVLLLVDEEDRPVGVLAGAACESPFNYTRMAGELCWWVDPEHRGNPESRDLIRAFEDWGRFAGCDKVVLATMADSRIGAIYKRHGYEKMEDSYLKDI